MLLMDYHHHTNHSFDSKAKMTEVCQHAVGKGIKEICFTEHFSLNPLAPTYGHINFEAYVNDIRTCQKQFENRLTVKMGIEICEPHQLIQEYKKVLEPLPFDFILGSVHNINNEKLRKYMENKSKDEVYRGYFTEVYEMVTVADIDVIAHIDLMKRYALQSLGNYQFQEYREILEAILIKAIDRQIGIEINTSGLRGKLQEALPTIDILKLYKKLGGELLTIGSDSHGAETVGADLPEAYEMAREAGFTSIFKYEKRNPIAVTLAL
ncbi:histidinol-phosphatase HisJ family protein [Bacillus sp. B15-48]|uniref:histidinol-phosphatase HisJ family protein n=1 Tax=Bacillus sp. B15-48 TaxID=1548601 RepID=UPI00193F40AE|nr:histidinol-phosphatase HisJ family protein [Bacillus sp. B15-48]MBM4760952.1 histidinol-phosphatase HisJ family protein [Bacillus sp. B15-48]